MPDYRMVTRINIAEEPEEFNQLVTELLERGYELYGPPTITPAPIAEEGGFYVVFSQALYKP
jgi:hypothetical protein